MLYHSATGLETIRPFLDRRSDIKPEHVNEDGLNALHVAIEEGQLANIKYLVLNSTIDPAAKTENKEFFFFFFFFFLFLSLFLSLFVCLFVCLFVVCLFVCMFVSLFVCLLFVCLYVCMSVCLFVLCEVCS